MGRTKRWSSTTRSLVPNEISLRTSTFAGGENVWITNQRIVITILALEEPIRPRLCSFMTCQYFHDSHDVRNEMSNSNSAEKYAFLMRKNKKIPDKGGICEQYDGFGGNHPDLFALGFLDPFMVWRGRAHHRASAQAGRPEQAQ